MERDFKIKCKKRFFLKHIIFTTIIILFISLGLSFKYEVRAANDENTYKLPVFETSDVHGYIAEQNGDNYQYLLSYISDKVKDVRGYGESYRKDVALLLDGGDMYQGNTMSNLLNGQSISAAYQMMDYDVVTIGNHEFDWDIENTIDSDGTMMDSNNKDFQVVNNIPVVASNLYLNSEKVNFAKDYVIVTKKARNANDEEVTVKIGVIGYLENYVSEIMPSKFIEKGYSIVDDLSIPENIAKQLEDSGEVDATILLCHYDALKLAEKIPSNSAIDMVLGGHSHVNSIGKTENGISYMQPVNYAKAYNYFELVFEKDSEGKVEFNTIDNMENIKITDSLDKTTNKPENSDELDSDLINLTDKILQNVQEVLEKKIGYITTDALAKEYISNSGDFSTVGGNWVSSIYTRAVNADVGFVNRGGVRYDFQMPEGQDKRYVTVGEIYSNFPFNNKIYKYEITYEELLKVLNYTLTDNSKTSIFSVVGIDCYHTNKEVNALVKDGVLIYQNGEWKDNWKNKTVTLATNQYVATTDNVVVEGFHNPMIEWNNTEKLVDTEKIDSECAIRILTEESEKNNGLLTIDDKAHYIAGIYQEQPIDEPTETTEDTDIEEKDDTTAEQTQIDNPKTTDNITVWISLILVSILGIVVTTNSSNKKS